MWIGLGKLGKYSVEGESTIDLHVEDVEAREGGMSNSDMANDDRRDEHVAGAVRVRRRGRLTKGMGLLLSFSVGESGRLSAVGRI